MDKKTVELYMEAKSQNTGIARFTIVFNYMFLGVSIFLLSIYPESGWSMALSFAAFINLIGQSKDFSLFGSNKKQKVTYAALLGALEAEINRDPQALMTKSRLVGNNP